MTENREYRTINCVNTQLINLGDTAAMKTYEVWVRLSPYQTTVIRITARSDYDAKMIAEAQFGVGNVLNYTEVSG